MLSALNQSIRNTIAYADVFDFPLNLDELHRYLISSKTVSRSVVEKAVQTDKTIVQSGLYYSMRNRPALVLRRKKNTTYTALKLRSANTTARLFGWLPTISAMFVTGSVAMGNATKRDDIDFFIVTKTGWLWTTRLLVALTSGLLGKYRTRSTHDVQNMWCFNMWLDETRLSVPPAARNLYTAHEVVQAKPIVDKAQTHLKFLAANAWVKTYLGNSVIPKAKMRHSKGKSNLIERLCYAVQRRYMQSALTTEKIGMHFAFFHPRNTSEMILAEFEKRESRKR